MRRFYERVRGGLRRRIREPLEMRLLGVVRRSSLLTALWCWSVGSYRVEQHALVEGLRAYERALDDEPVHLLRRNVHRLEKGLSMRPRRPVFALEYIDDTVDALAAVVRARYRRGAPILDESTRWARDVLSAYFEAAAVTPVTRAAAERAAATLDALGPPGGEVPGRHDSSTDVTYDQLRALADARASVRAYRPLPVDRDALDRAVDLAIQAPSACNRLPYEFRFVHDRERIEAIAAIAPGMKGWGAAVPCLCVVVGGFRPYFHPRDRHLPYVDSSLAVMGLELALVTLGLASCTVNWPQLPALDARLREVLALRPDEKPIVLLSIGTPAADAVVPASVKLPLDAVRRHEP